jgi:putative hydrolase of the HAD superfamily
VTAVTPDLGPGAPPVTLVCFDWGGVLLRIVRSFEEAVERAGLDLRPAARDPACVAARRLAAERYGVGDLETEAAFAAICAAMGDAYTPVEFARIHDAWLIEEYPGVGEVVERLLATPGVETALLSNTNDAHWRSHLPGPAGEPARFPLVARLHHRHASHLLRLRKPDEAIYRALERRTGRRGAQILFFDDLHENIAAARACGWRAERIDHTGDTAAQIERGLVAHGVWAR